MLSGLIFYSLQKGEIHIGRKNGNPVPEIILGSIDVKANHAVIKVNDKGIFSIEATDAEAAAKVLVNGKSLPKAKKTKVLNHLDRIAMPGGIIYMFEYPLLASSLKAHVESHSADNEGVDMNL